MAARMSRHTHRTQSPGAQPRSFSDALPQSPSDNGLEETPGRYSTSQVIQELLEASARFKKRIDSLQDELGLFSKECRELGRSYALIASVRQIKAEFAEMLSLFEENANTLSNSIRTPASTNHNDSPATAEIASKISTLFDRLAEAFETFRERLSDFREYTDESVKVKDVAKLFERDLKVGNPFHPMNMRLYISNLTEEMGDDFDCIHSAFKLFNTYGLPVMQYEQKRDAESVLNMSTVATFFSAVTATTLQMSVSIQGDSPNKAIIIVNTFWFCSLVLSIGAALNSLMAGAWKRTPYGRRGRTLPLWVTIWIHLSAPVFLAASIACFSIGLVFFAYGSDQKNITSVFTLITTIVTFFGFITVASWILYERWIAPWVSTISDLHNHEAGPSSGGKAADSAELKASRPQLRRSRSDSISVHSFGSARSSDSSFSIGIGHLFRYLAYQDSPQAEQPCDPEIQTPVPAPEEEQREPRRGMTWGAGARAVALQLAVTKELWTKTARAVPRMAQTMRRAITASASVPNLGSPIPPFPEVPVGPSYRAFRTDFGVLQDLEYSPDGTILVATNYDNERQQSRTICYRITETLYTFGPCKHTLGQISKQVAWSQDGKRILVRLDRGIDILDSHCKQLSSIKRPHQVESAAWCDANSQDLVSVERNVVFKLSHRGQTLERYPFDNLLLRDIAVVPGARFLLAVGRVTPLHGEMLLPHNSRAEKQLILYDMQSKKYLSRNPVLDDVRHVTLGKQLAKDESSSFDVVLVHKDTPPPQIWTLSIHVTSPPIIRPKIPRTLLQADLPGPAYLAGDREQMVLCVGHNGDVQIRDREQGWLVDSVPAQVVTNNWRCVAWCPVPQHPDSITFATAGAKGLKIWYITVPPRQPELGPVSSRSQSPDRPLTIFEEPVSPTMTPAESSPPNERVLSST